MNKENEIYQLNKVIPKLPKWFNNRSLICSQILINYLELETENNIVEYKELAEKCKHIDTFKENFDQMKNFGKKNHGKIFDVFDKNIKLWKPLKEEIHIQYAKSLEKRVLKDYKFVDTEKELINSTFEFINKPEFWKTTIGNAPRYFTHIKNGQKHYFGLSKFCAFKNITVEEYISNYRYKVNGGNTQKHISKITKKNWIPRNKIDNEIREEFDNWITSFHPNYTLENASFITISKKGKTKSRTKKFIDPKTLEERLKLQREIGKIGEEIALEFEINRVKKTGIKNAKKYIEHIAKRNSGAGFDISSLIKKDNRYIEVKSSLNDKLDFFITENEYYTLEELGNEAFIYMVHITDLIKKKGKVFCILKNPIKELNENGTLKPIAYKAKLNKKRTTTISIINNG